jgi:molybdate transport system substrate-binding protein
METEKTMRSLLAALVAAVLLGAPAQAKDVVVLCSTGLQSVLEALRNRYEAQSGDHLVITFDTSNLLKAKLDAGAPFDVAILTPALVAELVRQGRVAEGTAATLGRAGVGIAVKAGTPRPDISTVEALRATLIAAPSIAYTTSGQSGQAFMAAVAKLGLTDVVQGKARTITGGATGALVMRGEAVLAAQLIPELMAVPGLDIAGPLPPEVQSYVILAAGVGAASTDRTRAQALLTFLQGPEAMAVMRAKGLEPG